MGNRTSHLVDKLTAPEKFTSRIGSWKFLNIQTIVLILWVAWNGFLCAWIGFRPYDPFPFVFLNLMLSFQAAFTDPIVLMAQYAQAKRDARRDKKMEQMTEAILELVKNAQAHDEREEAIEKRQTESIQLQSEAIQKLITIYEKFPHMVRTIVREELSAYQKQIEE